MIRLSPTSLQQWYEQGCPARWNFEREWEPKAPNVMAERGKLVHRIMESKAKTKDMRADKIATRMAVALSDALTASGIQLFGTPEIKEEFQIRDDVTWVRRIDRFALMDGRPIIVDWKTTGNGWRSGENAEGQFTPQANAMQSIGYLLPSPTPGSLGRLDGWPPKTILYFVVGMRGPAQVYRYDWKEDDFYNFNQLVDAASGMIDSHYFPKVYGKHCLGNATTSPCPMHQLCFQTPGWEKLYTRYDPKKGRSKRTKKTSRP